MTESEKEFQDYWNSLGKRAYVERQQDAAALYGLNKKKVASFRQTSDWIIVHKGETFWAEVKESEQQYRFPFANIAPHQLARARMIAAAGGSYYFFIKSNVHGTWFKVPAALIHLYTQTGDKSVTWETLKEYTWVQ